MQSSKFQSLRRVIKAGAQKKHDLYMNNLVGDVKASTVVSTKSDSDVILCLQFLS